MKEEDRKDRCVKCSNVAVWQYMPSDVYRAYCEDCVPRGCSCREISLEKVDSIGRPLPCVDYWKLT